MRRSLLSIAAATLVLMSGCGDKKSETTTHETSSPVVEKKAVVEPAETGSAERTGKKTTETTAVETKSAVPESTAPVTDVVTAAKEEVAKKVESVTESVAQSEAAAKEGVEEKVEAAKNRIDVTTLYTKCAGCHGMKGEKHALGKSNVIAGQPKEDLVKKIEGYQNGSYGGAMKVMMAGQVKGLTPDQIDALADYISKM
ncbi:c-type cytochrome [Hydrogenimonas sp.]